jgi:beta-aspartyl-peptidase (threonine type)
MPDRRWSIAVHGGAKTIEDAQLRAHLDGCAAAAEAGATVLRSGGTAVDAVVAAIRCLEDDPTFNAGAGSVRTRAGEVENDAAVMDGAALDVGAVAALAGARNPIEVARALLREKTVLLAGEGAAAFARAIRAEPSLDSRPAAGGPASDTVGCVAIDEDGHFAAGTSTGGLDGKEPGRVGDSPLPGCGLFAEDGVGAVSVSGDGESIARVALASFAMGGLRDNDAQAAADAAVLRLARVQGEGGLIVLDRQHRFGWSHNSPDFAVAHAASGSALRTFTRKEDRDQ